jgi:OOP family OmpA-OmpF porin
MSDLRRYTYALAIAAAFGLQLPAHAEDAAASTDAAPADTSSADSSMAAPAEDTRYIGVLGTYTFTDDSRSPVDYGGGAHIILGKQYSEKLNFEFTGDANVYETGKHSGSDFYLYQLGVDALYYLHREGLSPFLLGGLGYAHDDVTHNDDDGVYANAGVGFLTAPLNDRGVALRGDVRYIRDFNNGGFDDIRVGLGLQVPFNKPGTVVTQVSSADSDGDGVVDGVDKCPGTLKGLKVDQYGCAIAQTLVLKGVSFDFDSVRLGVNAQTILDEVVTSMKGQPTMKVEIAGHTDNYGSEEYNQSLSQRRADAVREYLVSKGVAADSLRSTGYGESQPIASNDDDFGREQNRRVEFRIESQ